MMEEAERYPHWRRTIWILAATVVTSFIGFDFVMPFLPIYFRELGVSENLVPLLTGLALGVSPLASALTAPFWGALTDRYGAKLMLQRTLLSFVFTIGAFAFAQEVWQALVLRVLIGALGGMTSVAIATAASESPPKHVSESVGLIQGAQTGSMMLGPAIGGLCSSWFGLRPTFLIAATMQLIAFAVVTALYRERPSLVAERQARRQPADESPRPRGNWAQVVAIPGFVLLMAMLLCIQFVERGMGLMTPVYMNLLDTGGWTVATLAGVAFSVAALSSTISATVAGRLAVRHGAFAILRFCLPAGALVLIPFMMLAFGWQLVAMRALLGLIAGASMTLAYTLGSRLLPERSLGTGYGFLSSATQLGGSISLFITGVIATVDVRYVFLLDVVLYTVALTILYAGLRPRLTLAESAALAAEGQPPAATRGVRPN